MSELKIVSTRLSGITRRRLMKVIDLGLVTGLVDPVAFRAFA